MKVYVTDEKELIMELSMKWAGNPNILVAVKAFGLRATVQVLALVLVDDYKLTSLLCVCDEWVGEVITAC